MPTPALVVMGVPPPPACYEHHNLVRGERHLLRGTAKIPSASPRPFLNHVDISLRAGGYTPATKNPVAKRSGIPRAVPSTIPSSPLAITAPIDPPRITCLGDAISERFRTLETSAPHTKPS